MMNFEQNRVQRGFTLIELLVVLAILALLAGLVGPQIMKALGGAKSKAAIVQLGDLGAALDLYRLDIGHYPSGNHGLQSLVNNEEGNKRWNGPYLTKRKVPQDPWGYDYFYEFPGDNGEYDLYSLGSDNATGGDGEKRDILGWE